MKLRHHFAFVRNELKSEGTSYGSVLNFFNNMVGFLNKKKNPLLLF